MKRDLVKLVGSILLGGIAVLVALTACGGSTGATTPAPSLSAATATAEPATQLANKATGDFFAKGKLIFEKTAGGVGCASCHGMDGKGNATVGVPDNRGAPDAKVRAALAGGVPLMSFINLSDEEITAVVAYLQYLNERP